MTPERALLNAVPASYAVVSDVEGPPVDGERALLGRSASVASYGLPLATRWQEEALAVDGERALRGIVTQKTRRRLTLAQ